MQNTECQISLKALEVTSFTSVFASFTSVFQNMPSLHIMTASLLHPHTIPAKAMDICHLAGQESYLYDKEITNRRTSARGNSGGASQWE